MNTIAINPFDQIATEISIPGHDRGSFKETEALIKYGNISLSRL